jgi:TPR repeat protein
VQSININPVKQVGISGFASHVRLFVLIFITLLLLSLSVQADEMFDLQLKLAKQGDAEAQLKVGEMYQTGIGVNQNIKEAMYWIRRSANQGHEIAGFQMLFWDVEKKGLKGKSKAKLEELNMKAKQGNPQAQYYLGKMYAHGIGINKNRDVAIDWLNKAALAGVLEAELELASVKEDKTEDTPKERRFKSDICSGKSAKFTSTCR